MNEEQERRLRLEQQLREAHEELAAWRSGEEQQAMEEDLVAAFVEAIEAAPWR